MIDSPFSAVVFVCFGWYKLCRPISDNLFWTFFSLDQGQGASSLQCLHIRDNWKKNPIMSWFAILRGNGPSQILLSNQNLALSGNLKWAPTLDRECIALEIRRLAHRVDVWIMLPVRRCLFTNFKFKIEYWREINKRFYLKIKLFEMTVTDWGD